MRRHRRRLEPNVGGWASGTAQEGQTEGAVEPCRRRKSQANEKRRKASRNRFPFCNRFPNIRKKWEAVSCWKFNGLPCGKPTASHFSPSMTRVREAVCFPQAQKRTENTKRKPPPEPTVKLNQKTDCRDGNCTGVRPSGRPDKMPECSDCAGFRPKTPGARECDRFEQIVA